MASVVKPFTFTAGATIIASEHNSNFDTLYNDYNTNITNVNIAAGAVIAASKLNLTSIAQNIATTGTLTMSSAIFKGAKGADVASVAGTMTLGDDGNYFDITGTNAITSITIKAAGTVVTLQFDSTASMVDGGNLKLNGNFQGAAESQMTLVSDGTSWVEISRTPTSITSSDFPSASIIQTKITQSSAVAQSTGTAIWDDSIPQLSECPVLTAFNTTFTASSASNALLFTVVLNLSQDSANNYGVIAVFVDSATNSSAAAGWDLSNAVSDLPNMATMQFYITPSDTSSHTYKLGIGCVSGAVITINGADGSRKLGGVYYSSMKIDELKA